MVAALIALDSRVVVESSRYEQWMKMATDNKITANNAWTTALIDYFADMSLLRNTDDNSINFQKASCTLDGCVKIWTSRVDSVATETTKLMSGLSADPNHEPDDQLPDDDDEDDDARKERQTKQKASRQAATLADSFAKLKLKALELEFTVDPLFKKTSADFDEGGAGGILMNHLGCDRSMRVVFDAGDARLDDDEDEAEEEEVEEQERLDVGKLKSAFLPSLELFTSKTLCPSLSAFRFSPDANLDLGILNPVDDEIPPPPAPLVTFAEHIPNPFGDDDHFIPDEFGGGDDGNDMPMEEDFFAAEQAMGNAGMGPVEGFDPSRIGNDGADHLVLSFEGGEGSSTMDYFDNNSGKNWAGPEHWKMRRAVVKKDVSTPSKPREKKAPFIIDFLDPTPINTKELFAPGVTSTIRSARKKSLPSASSRRSSRPTVEKEDSFTIPDDFHFTSSVLLRLFLKPKLCFGMRRGNAGNGREEVDEEFWAANGAAGGDMGEDDGYGFGGNGDDDEDELGNDLPTWDTQFLHGDDMDLPDFEEDLSPLVDPNSVEGEEDDLLKATQGQLRRVRPEEVNYAKRAKRVDVKRLKDSIWRELETVTIGVTELPIASAFQPDVEPAATPKPEAFTSVISGLRKLYPAEKMSEISTSFCFICLLHLANEKGLRIQTPAATGMGEVDDGLLERRSVGGLDQLRVFREITA